MAACVHCRQRKGKRECPALGGRICPACCGEYRQVEIACPPYCVYLESHGAYQRRRTLDRVPPAWIGRIMAYEKREPSAQEIVHEIQVSICRFARERGAVDRESAREALEFARSRMSVIDTPMAYVPPLGEFLVERLDALIQARELVEREGVRRVLEETLEHLESEVPAGSFDDFLGFLRALYSEHLGGGAERSSSNLIVPG